MKAPSARPMTQSLRRDPRNVEFTQVDEVIESDGGEETAEDSVREVRMHRMSLMNAIKEPSIEDESGIKLAIGNSNVEPNYTSCQTTMSTTPLEPRFKTYMATTTQNHQD